MSLIRSFAILVSGMALTTSAFAADLAPAAVPYDWSGFYIGGQVGIDMLHPHPTVAGDIQPEATGFEGGLNTQALWQSGNLVFGGIADFNLSTTNASALCSNAAYTCKDASSWNASLRAKLGFASENAMFYGTGGWGWADYHGETNNGTAFPGVKSLNGWVAGAGIAYAINDKWSVGAEYLHYDLGSSSVTTINYDVPYSVQPTIDTLTLNLGYKF
jgi:outer membrane immunogenic protein